MENKNNRISPYKICIVALAVCINLAGGQLALLLRLPVYLDSIGTFFVGAVLGPLYGMLPNFLSGIIFGMTTDIYSLYYAPVGILLGLFTGLVCHKNFPKGIKIFPAALLITIPTTIVSASITSILFGGITSSGSTLLVQILAKSPLGLTGACFVVQFITDYADRIISLFLVAAILKALPHNLKEKLRRS